MRCNVIRMFMKYNVMCIGFVAYGYCLCVCTFVVVIFCYMLCVCGPLVCAVAMCVKLRVNVPRYAFVCVCCCMLLSPLLCIVWYSVLASLYVSIVLLCCIVCASVVDWVVDVAMYWYVCLVACMRECVVCVLLRLCANVLVLALFYANCHGTLMFV